MSTTARGSPTAPARPLLWQDPVLRGLGLFGLLVAVWFPVGIGPVGVQVVLFWVIQVALNLVFIVLCLRVTRLDALRPEVCRFWRLVAAAGVLFALSDGAQAVVALSAPTYASISSAPVPGVILTIGVAVVIVATLIHPVRVRGRERLRWWLDAATIMTGAAAFIWAFLWAGQGLGDLTRLTLVVLASGLMLVAGFGLVKLLIGGNAPFTRASGIAATLTAVLLATDSAVTTAPAASGAPGVVMAVRLIASIVLVASPRIQEIQVAADPAVMSPRTRGRYSRLPYLAVAATQGLLVGVLVADGLTPTAWGVLAAALLGIVLVIARQLVAFDDNARLLSTLDDAMLGARRQEQRFRSLVQYAADITAITDAAGHVTYMSPATHRVLDLDPDELTADRFRDFIHPKDLPWLTTAIRELLRDDGAVATHQFRARRADGSWRWLEMVSTNLLHDPSVGGLVHNISDITDARQAEDRLRYEATHDPLTQLANRSLFNERVQFADDPDESLAILAIDLDDFKAVNDTLGHHVGDGLLVAVADRIRRCVRPGDTVARLGGDEFAVVLPGATGDDAAAIGQRIRQSVEQPVAVDGHPVTVAASVGIAVGPARDAERLSQAADSAMYRAKQTNQNPFVTGTPAPTRARP